MLTRLREPAVIGLSTIGLALGLACSAQASTVLPVQNLTFSQYSGANPKNNFSTVNPADWYRGPPAGQGDLVFIDAPGTATSFTGGYGVYGPFANPPSGGNFVQADGNPDFESTFKQNIAGLVAGQTYTLSFWQAAGQQSGFSGATTEQWKVFLGNGNVTLTGPDNNGIYGVSAAGNVEADSTLMNTPSKGVTDWQEVTLSFVAPTTGTDTLTFLAWGNGGSNANLPPTVFLAGVNTPSKAPEPASLSLLAAGLLGLGGVVRRRRAKRNAS